jgi:hypothetical protein
MSLSDYKAETREFTIKGNSIVVRGLSLVEATKLIRHHLPDLESLFKLIGQVMDGKKEMTPDDLDNITLALVENAPGFVGNIIALAEVNGKRDEAAAEAAMNLTFPLQVEMLAEIGRLTFDEVGGIKKAFGLIVKMLGSKTGKQLADKLTTAR